MSDAYDKGKSYELKVQKLTAKILHLEVKRDSRSGAGTHKADIRDRYNELPIFIECKNQETLKLKEWWNDANAKSSFGQAPIVVFPYETEDLCIMRYTDLLQIVKEMFDWKESYEDERTAPAIMSQSANSTSDKPATKPDPVQEAKEFATQAKANKPEKTYTCRNGHLADQYGYCYIKDCKYRRGYKPPKKSKKG